jgi:photosystem II stability/assembly factor-like uncharacterized protein
MRRSPSIIVLFVLLAMTASAQYDLYTCASISKGYVVGAPLPPSGLFALGPDEKWQHFGFNHPFLAALDYDPTDHGTLFLAAGNGLIRAADHGRKWTVLTGSDITEIRDVAVTPSALYIAHSHGIRVSHDRGATWQEIGDGLHRRFTESIRADRMKPGVLLAGGEEGIYRSGDEGKTWKLAGAAGFQILHIEQSPHDACFWLAVTQGGGLFSSHDCGVTFENSGNIGVGRNLYDVEFDASWPQRIAVVGWGVGFAISLDAGKSWQQRNAGLPRPDVWSVALDPEHPSRVYVSIHEEAIYRSDDNGLTWMRQGLEGSVAPRMKFIPK